MQGFAEVWSAEIPGAVQQGKGSLLWLLLHPGLRAHPSGHSGEQGSRSRAKRPVLHSERGQ